MHRVLAYVFFNMCTSIDRNFILFIRYCSFFSKLTHGIVIVILQSVHLSTVKAWTYPQVPIFTTIPTWEGIKQLLFQNSIEISIFSPEFY